MPCGHQKQSKTNAYVHTGFWWVMNTVDPRWKNGIDFEDVNSLLHIMIRNKSNFNVAVLWNIFYPKTDPNTDLFRIPTGDVFHTSPTIRHPAANYEYISTNYNR
jgi:hypothetical protein